MAAPRSRSARRALALTDPGSAEAIGDDLGPVVEDHAEIAAHERQRELTERLEWQGVAHLVGHAGAAVADRLEPVGVVPEAERPAKLGVDEPVRRVPVLDGADPVHRDAVQSHRVLDDRPGTERDWRRREQAEVEQRWSDRLEVERIREEREHLVGGTLQLVGARERMDSHDGSTAESGPRIDGPADAPLITMHADLSCPDCALALHRLRQIRLRIDLRHFVVKARGIPARRAALAAEAAAVQGAFWPFARGLLADQGRQDPPHLWALAESLGLDVDRFERDRQAERGHERVALETKAAIRGGATGIPAIFADTAAAEYLRRSGYDADVRIRS